MNEIVKDLQTAYLCGERQHSTSLKDLKTIGKMEYEALIQKYTNIAVYPKEPFVPEMLETEEFGKWAEIKSYPACKIYGHRNHILYAHNDNTYDLMTSKEHCLIVSGAKFPFKHEAKIILDAVTGQDKGEG